MRVGLIRIFVHTHPSEMADCMGEKMEEVSDGFRVDIRLCLHDKRNIGLADVEAGHVRQVDA
jgi:hypothetical protein